MIFFKHLAIYSILKKREFAASKLLPQPRFGLGGGGGFGGPPGMPMAAMDAAGAGPKAAPPPVRVLETGVVGTLDYSAFGATSGAAVPLEEFDYRGYNA